jgi:exopolysaccharide biosynthesis WecB/TagA/CpsF family protein
MAKIQTQDLFGFSVVNASATRTVAAVLEPGKRAVAFLNAHCINIAHRDPVYRWALSRADYVLPDGSGVQFAAKLDGHRFVENLNGTDLFPEIVRQAANAGLRVYFLGSLPGVAEDAAKSAVALAPSLQVAGTRDGFFTELEEEAVIAEINATETDVLLVALGVPKQDVWIARNLGRLNVRVVFGVGAQFDFWGKRVSRAPQKLRKLGLEWTWRLALEPRRMFTRYVFGNPAFVFRALKYFASKKLALGQDSLMMRLLDLSISGFSLIALLPLLFVIATAIKCETKGPVLFRQVRVGRSGQAFEILKFRSMYEDAEARRSALLHSSERKGICFKNRQDPRITKVGRFLRRYSFDELPQILNVLRGDMSIVGPRPALMQEVAKYPVKALSRLAVKPGLTGIWQVSGRAEVSFDRMINMDIAFAKSRGVLVRLMLMVLTVRAVLSGRGAY